MEDNPERVALAAAISIASDLHPESLVIVILITASRENRGDLYVMATSDTIFVVGSIPGKERRREIPCCPMKSPKIVADTGQSRRIDDWIYSKLKIKGATGIEQYERRLKENAGNEEVLNDLLFEARAALMFLHYDWFLLYQEIPDLELSLNGELLYAEVKHFREKEQDRLNTQAMLAATNLCAHG